MATIKRKLIQAYSSPIERGFLGNGHLARAVIQVPYSQSDPFIALMDDILDKKDNSPAGGRHPHAGFETVSLLVDGKIGDMIESLKAGDFQIMTAGSGIVHTETIDQPTKGRLFQLWLNLPARDKMTEPKYQEFGPDRIPVATPADGVSVKVIAGEVGSVNGPISW